MKRQLNLPIPVLAGVMAVVAAVGFFAAVAVQALNAPDSATEGAGSAELPRVPGSPPASSVLTVLSAQQEDAAASTTASSSSTNATPSPVVQTAPVTATPPPPTATPTVPVPTPTLPPATPTSVPPAPTPTSIPAPATATPTPPPPAGGGITIWTIDGLAYLVADDGTYLGRISSKRYDTDSICNRYGDYGSKYSSESVRNPYGDYGSKYSSLSAYDKYTSTPPAIVLDGAVIGYLTKNDYLPGAVDPDILFAAYDCVD